MYDGGIRRELAGAEINEENIVSSSLNIDLETGREAAEGAA
jgi:hypothetical protein